MPQIIFDQNLFKVNSDIRIAPFSTGWRSLPFSFVEYSPDGEWTVEIESRHVFRIKPNCPFIVPSFTRHSLSVRDQEKLRTFWMILPFSRWDGIDLFFEHKNLIQLKRSSLIRVRQIMMEVYDLVPCKEGYSSEACLNRLAWELLQIILEEVPLRTGTNVYKYERLAKIVAFVKGNIGKNISRADMANLVNLSPTRFHYVFKEAFGMAPVEYVTMCRLKIAQDLLMNGDKSISEIADICGFRNLFYFSRIFKKKTGYSPSSFRTKIVGKGGKV